MTKSNIKTRTTCFFCRYEINKHNKVTKHVIYNKQLRPICKYCTKSKHKPLENKYTNVDTQCKLCIKPTLYKKCIACSICDHFYHGKCLELSKKEIDQIENVCGFYICKNCSQEALPNQINDEQPKSKIVSKTKLELKNCLTCSKDIKKINYPNKHLLYNNVRCLCENCSIHALDIPVKDTNLIEFQDCSICKKIVRYESIFCNLCQHLVHPYCNGIGKNELNILGKTEENWYCLNCNKTIYPNQLLTYATTCKITKKQETKIKQEYT